MNKKVLKIVSISLGVTALGFFGYTLSSSWRDLDASNFAPNWEWTIPIVFLTLSTFISGFLWNRVVKNFTGETIPAKEALESHFGAWVMRYIPTVGYVSYKSIRLIARGVRFRFASVPILFEGLYVQIASLVLGIALLGPALVRSDRVSPLLSAAALTGLVFVVLFFLKPFLVATVLRLSVEERLVHTKITFTELQLLFYYVVPRMMTAAAAAVTGMSLGGKTMADSLTIGGAFVLAAALGVLVPFVPSGLGIRESVFVGVLVTLGWSVSFALSLSIILRFLTTLSDCIIAMVWAWLRRGIALDNQYDREER